MTDRASEKAPHAGPEPGRLGRWARDPTNGFMLVSVLLVLFGVILVPPDGSPPWLDAAWFLFSLALLAAWAKYLLGTIQTLLSSMREPR